MNRIYRNLVVIFIALTMVIFLILSVGMVKQNIEEEEVYLADIAKQVTNNILREKEAYKNKVDLMEGVWADRVRNAEYIISHEDRMKGRMELNQLKVIIGARAVHLFDSKGNVIVSSDEDAVGKPLQGEEELFQYLRNGEIHKDYYMHIEDSGFWRDPSYCRMIMLSTNESYSALCIEADTNQMGLKCERTIIENTLKKAATEFGTSVAAVGSDTGAVLGMTNNNEDRMEIKGKYTGKKRMDYMKSILGKKAAFAEINDQYSILVTDYMEGAYIVAYMPLEELLQSSIVQWRKALFFFVLAIGIELVTIRYNFRKYLLRHLEEMESRLGEILEGNFNVTLSEGNNKDINKLVRVIEKLKTGYIHKSERTDKMLDVLGENIAVFECVFEAEYFYFSDKMRNILSMSESEWTQAQTDRNSLIDLLRSLDSKKDEEDIVLYRGKYLEIQLCPVEDELVGVLLDKTDEVTQRYALEAELRRSKEKMERDPLTQVLNRGGFESCVKKYLRGSGEGGVLIEFDLDNFKNINDSLGHPEGDRLLKIFATCLTAMFRSNDIVGRIGGDEFSVFMTNPGAAKIAEEKVRNILDRLNVHFGEYHFNYGVSTSAGIVYARKNDNYEELYRKADEALYMAKKSGKNCYAVYDKMNNNSVSSAADGKMLQENQL